MKQFLVLNPRPNVLIFVGESTTGKSFLSQHTRSTNVYDDISIYDKTLVRDILTRIKSGIPEKYNLKLVVDTRLQLIICNDISVATQYYNDLSNDEVRR